MAYMQGWADAPSTGAYDEQEVAPVFAQAVKSSLWQPLAKRVNISGGYTVTVPIRGALSEPSNSALTESLSIPLDKLTITAKAITMVERGRGVMVSQKDVRRSPIDLLSEHQTALAEQMGLDMDTVFDVAFTGGKLIYQANGPASYVLVTNGTANTSATNQLNFYHVRKMRDLAFSTYTMPKLPDGTYKLVAATAGIRGILDDPEFLEINKGSNASVFESNRVGRIADVEVIEEQHTLSNAMGTNTDIGQAVFIAKDAVYYAMLEAPSIHWDRTWDHGRFTSLAWYGDWGCGTSTDSANAGLVRLIHFGSS
jgi:N4-gp56 family major capsid protein